MSPPPLPGLSPPPPLEAGRRGLKNFQQEASAAIDMKAKSDAGTGAAADSAQQTTYFRSETPSEVAGFDGRTALAVAEGALERAMSGQEPVTASHFHNILGALAQIAHEVCLICLHVSVPVAVAVSVSVVGSAPPLSIRIYIYTHIHIHTHKFIHDSYIHTRVYIYT